MKFCELRKSVYEANMELARNGLVILTWGNVSACDRDAGIIAIKPSGVKYENMTPEDIPVLELESGKQITGKLKPSSDTPTHLILYRMLPQLGGIAHTHSHHATAFAQAGMAIPCLGTTHADSFYGEIPVSRPLRSGETHSDYELNTGRVILELWAGKEERAMEIPAALVAHHGPFTWGEDAAAAVHHAFILEEVARIAASSLALKANLKPISHHLLDRHFLRKHGSDAYYGQ